MPREASNLVLLYQRRFDPTMAKTISRIGSTERETPSPVQYRAKIYPETAKAGSWRKLPTSWEIACGESARNKVGCGGINQTWLLPNANTLTLCSQKQPPASQNHHT